MCVSCRVCALTALAAYLICLEIWHLRSFSWFSTGSACVLRVPSTTRSSSYQYGPYARGLMGYAVRYGPNTPYQ